MNRCLTQFSSCFFFFVSDSDLEVSRSRFVGDFDFVADFFGFMILLILIVFLGGSLIA